MFYVASCRFSVSMCQVVFGCVRTFRLFMMYSSFWMFLDRLCCFRMVFFKKVFVLLKVVVEVEKVVQVVRFALYVAKSVSRCFSSVQVE